MYLGGAEEIEGRRVLMASGEERISVIGLDTSEICTVGGSGTKVISEAGRDDFGDSFDTSPFSSSASGSEASESTFIDLILLVRGRARLSCLSRVNPRRRAFRSGATGVVIVSGLLIEISSSELLSLAASLDARRGYKN